MIDTVAHKGSVAESPLEDNNFREHLHWVSLVCMDVAN